MKTWTSNQSWKESNVNERSEQKHDRRGPKPSNHAISLVNGRLTALNRHWSDAHATAGVNVVNITKCDLSKNELRSLKNIEELLALTWLKVEDNQLTDEGVESIQSLTKLVVLNLSKNRLCSLEPRFFKHLTISLKALVLSYNEIKSLEWLPSLNALNSLIVSHNRVTAIPKNVSQNLLSLAKLSMSHNQLESIPDLSALTQLCELRLSHNRIREVPSTLANNFQLRILDLGHNQIDSWEGIEALGSMEALRQFNLSGNPLCGQALALVNHKKTTLEKSLQESNISNDSENNQHANNNLKASKTVNSATLAGAMDVKEAKRLEAKHKHYNFTMKRLFPHLVIRDGERIMNKRSHGYGSSSRVKANVDEVDVDEIKVNDEREGNAAFVSACAAEFDTKRMGRMEKEVAFASEHANTKGDNKNRLREIEASITNNKRMRSSLDVEVKPAKDASKSKKTKKTKTVMAAEAVKLSCSSLNEKDHSMPDKKEKIEKKEKVGKTVALETDGDGDGDGDGDKETFATESTEEKSGEKIKELREPLGKKARKDTNDKKKLKKKTKEKKDHHSGVVAVKYNKTHAKKHDSLHACEKVIDFSASEVGMGIGLGGHSAWDE